MKLPDPPGNDAKLAALRAALRAGEESGDPVTFDVDDFIKRQKGNA